MEEKINLGNSFPVEEVRVTTTDKVLNVMSIVEINDKDMSPINPLLVTDVPKGKFALFHQFKHKVNAKKENVDSIITVTCPLNENNELSHICEIANCVRHIHLTILAMRKIVNATLRDLEGTVYEKQESSPAPENK